MCARPRTGQLLERDAHLLDRGAIAQVDDGQVADLDAPQATPLLRGVDGAASGGLPLGPDGGRGERRVERPRLTGTVVTALRRGGTVWGQGRRTEPGLAVDATGEAGDRDQM
jgi:hypothetical protein